MSVIREVGRSWFAGRSRPGPRPWPTTVGGARTRHLAADLGMAVGVGVTTALVWSLLPTIARRGGADGLSLALLAATPFAANVLSILAGRVGPHTPRGLAVLRGLGGLLLVLLVLDAGTIPMVLIALGFWLSIGFGSPLQTRLWGQMYPTPQRGRLVGVVGTGRAGAAGLGMLLGGLLADRLGGLQVVALGGLLGLLFGSLAVSIRLTDEAPSRAYSVRASLRTLTSRPALRLAALGQGFLGGGLIAASPLLAFVQVDRLSLSLTEVGTLGILAAAATTTSFVLFGYLIDRRGGVVTLRLGALFGVAGLLIYAVAPSLPVLWLAAICLGLSSAAVDMGTQGVVAEQTPIDERSAAMAGWNAMTGLRGMFAPFLATGLMALGVVDVTGGILLAAAVSVVGLAIFLRIDFGRTRREVATAGGADGTGAVDTTEPRVAGLPHALLSPRHAARRLMGRLAHA